MKKIIAIAVVALAMTGAARANAKTVPIAQMPRTEQQLQQLRNGDSFSVECRNTISGVIDRESVDVDAGTVTVEMPSGTTVHKITDFAIGTRTVPDKFDQPLFEMSVVTAAWGKTGAYDVGLTQSADGRMQWFSYHEDKSLWHCAR